MSVEDEDSFPLEESEKEGSGSSSSGDSSSDSKSASSCWRPSKLSKTPRAKKRPPRGKKSAQSEAKKTKEEKEEEHKVTYKELFGEDVVDLELPDEAVIATGAEADEGQSAFLHCFFQSAVRARGCHCLNRLSAR